MGRGGIESIPDEIADDLDRASFFKGLVHVFGVQGFQGAGGDFDADELFQFGNPNAFGPEIRVEETGRVGSHVHPNTAFFLGLTATIDPPTFGRGGFGNDTFSGHKFI
jgi:hypothetical protein